MLFLQIYIIISAVITVFAIKGLEKIPNGPSNLLSAILTGLMVGLLWPLSILLVSSEASGRRNNE